MPDDEPQQKSSETFDVVWMRGPTSDGKGTQVVRARPGRIDAGEVRPLREGRPIAAGGEVVRLEQRSDAPALYDVHVEYAAPATAAKAPPRLDRPPQVATHAYRENWELTFGARPREAMN
jgi:hypothetical protein